MFNQIDVDGNQIELSAQELEEVAGGIDIFMSGSVYENSEAMLAQNASANSNGGGTSSVFKSSHTFSSAFQFIGLGFNSMGDVMNVFSGLAKLFGRRS